MGIYAAREHIGPVTEKIRGFLDDTEYVRAELAAALYSSDRVPDAFGALKELLMHDNPMISHQAVQKVLYMPDAAEDFSGVISALHAKIHAEDHVAPSGNIFPLEQAVDMYMYIYAGKELYYEQDLNPVIS